ncbi:RES family NAD+ phosphorylase [Luteolibacter sp. LG18]|uniref:RES family NAD+ phosphorylase n=1 Tax=Luteolibacter sp. LG18 TaxID=2819286 RepID=UPI0030C7426D
MLIKSNELRALARMLSSSQEAMKRNHRVDGDQHLCWMCVSDKFLKQRIKQTGRRFRCSFCERPSAKTVPLSLLANWIEKVFEDHFERTSPDPSDDDYWHLRNSECGSCWYRDGEPLPDLICEITGVNALVSDALVEILSDRHFRHDLAEMGEECDFAKDSSYSERGISQYGHHQEAWHNFEQSLHRDSRFFNRYACEVLDEIFQGVEDLGTYKGECPVRDIGPGTDIENLFRARVFQSAETLERALKRPDLEIAPPPNERAAAGRMNPHGVSVFYGASTPATALAEVRPPVGADVVIGEFELRRSVRILDLRKLQEVVVENSYFDENCRTLIERAAFLRELSCRIVQPAMPERADRDYLVTQVIADYLASQRNLDGILFPSVQTSEGFNVVLFPRASRTERFALPEGADISVGPAGYDDDRPSRDFSVHVSLPPTEEGQCDLGDESIAPFAFPNVDNDSRQTTLRLRPSSIVVHRVREVRFETIAATVMRTELPRGPDLSWML